jgi:hypothetical protein
MKKMIKIYPICLHRHGRQEGWTESRVEQAVNNILADGWELEKTVYARGCADTGDEAQRYYVMQYEFIRETRQDQKDEQQQNKLSDLDQDVI